MGALKLVQKERVQYFSKGERFFGKLDVDACGVVVYLAGITSLLLDT